MDEPWIAVTGALVGALGGSLGVWLASRLRDRERDTTSSLRSLQEKIHQVEVRIVKLETEFAFYADVAEQRLKGVGLAQQG